MQYANPRMQWFGFSHVYPYIPQYYSLFTLKILRSRFSWSEHTIACYIKDTTAYRFHAGLRKTVIIIREFDVNREKFDI